jgi:hypothetical protein
MTRVPKAALLISSLGLVPFFLCASLIFLQSHNPNSPIILADNVEIKKVLVVYGAIILSFMSGTLWGFAASNPSNKSNKVYALSVIPALISIPIIPGHFFSLGYYPKLSLIYLFLKKLAPRWWMKLRIPLTLLVSGCLLIGIMM